MSESKQAEQPTLELIYFDIPGRGEPIRKAFKFGCIKFTDTRFAFKDWPTVKPTTCLGSVPVLKVDGKMYFLLSLQAILLLCFTLALDTQDLPVHGHPALCGQTE